MGHMPTLLFPDRETLGRALAGGATPGSVSQAPARVGFDDQGRRWLATDGPISREALGALIKLGVQSIAGPPGDPVERVSCWHQLVPLRSVPFRPEDLGRPALFEVSATQWAAVAGEVRRLGEGHVSFRWLTDPTAEDSAGRL